jgi:hypothetical protein
VLIARKLTGFPAQRKPVFTAYITMKNILCVIIAMTVFSVAAQSAYKLVDGKVYSVIDPNVWTAFGDNLKVIGYSKDGIICESYRNETHDAGGQMNRNLANPRYVANNVTRIIPVQKFILKNYWQMNAPLGSDISPPIKAIRTGQTSITRSGDTWTTSPVYSGSSHTVSVIVYDMGVDYSPPARVLTPEEQKAAVKKHAEQEAKTFKWLYSQATNGSASAQCSVGKRYLIGQGVETNEALGIEWLNKAAAQGDMEASNKLARLSASTSDPLVSTTSSQK